MDIIIEQIETKLSAEKTEIALASAALKSTPQQAEAYVVQQITNGISEATALAAFDAALTFATVKPILRNMLVGMYRTVDILKLIVRVLVIMRDHLWRNL